MAYYETLPELEIRETQHLVVDGEDFDGDVTDEKPLRSLTNFSIFDPNRRNELVSLAALDEDDGEHRQFEAAGYVVPYFINEEDQGQEDGLPNAPQYVRLSSILQYRFDYTKESE